MNPTPTLPALAMRANGYLIEQYKRCEIWSGVRRIERFAIASTMWGDLFNRPVSGFVKS